jgi:hypothetical protein
MFEDDHPLRDQLEAYALGRTAPEDLERIETHLLICEHCQGEVSQTEEYFRAMKRAAGVLKEWLPG